MKFPEQKSIFLIDGPAGALEIMTTPAKVQRDDGRKILAVICHPDPRQEGTMHNKVVTTLARAYENVGCATVRFNFRGVGKSEGTYGDLQGELADLETVIAWVQKTLPGFELALAGFSFGSYIAAQTANDRDDVVSLISIAPPVHHYPFETLDQVTVPWLVVQGDDDEVVPFDEVQAFALTPPSSLEFTVMEGVGHFFHGKLIELREILTAWLKKSL